MPIVCVKIGRSDEGRKMAQAHTGHLTGVDAVHDAVFDQFGVVRVDDLDELIAMIIVPFRSFVLFPGMVMPTVGRPRSIAAAQQAVREQRQVGILMQREPNVADPSPIDMHRMGTIANVMRCITGRGSQHLVCQGEQRFQVLEFLSGWPFFVARVLRIPESDSRTPEIEARFVHLLGQAIEALELLPQAPQELVGAVTNASTATALADLVAAYLDIAPDAKQELLETIDVVARLDKVPRLLAHRIEVLRLFSPIGGQTKAALDERQREALLREQMAAIQKKPAKAKAARPPSWPKSTRRSPRPACPRTWRSTLARNYAGCNACRTALPSTAWRGPIWIG